MLSEFHPDPTREFWNVLLAGSTTIHDIDAGATLYGGLANEPGYGCGGNDVIFGGDGNDYIRAGVGTNTLYCGAGDNYLSFFNATSNAKTVNLETNSVSGGPDNDDVISGFHIISTSCGNDILYGTSGANRMRGYAGNDTIFSEDSNDCLCSSGGDNTVYGGAGNDSVRVDGNGPKTFYGGDGND